MCLLAFAWQVDDQPLLLLGNRDEFHVRPTRPAGFWDDRGHPQLLAGQDLQAGGTWLGVTRNGRFACLTNIRSGNRVEGVRSRGSLVLDYLLGSTAPEVYLQALQAQAGDYGGFNLLVGDSQQLWHLHSHGAIVQAIEPGLHVLSNADLDSPWPKACALRDGLQHHLHASDQQLLALLTDSRQYPDEQLPDTGVPLAWERRLSAAFILGEEYGTRACSLLRLQASGEVSFIERRFVAQGMSAGEQRWQFSVTG